LLKTKATFHNKGKFKSFCFFCRKRKRSI